MICTIIAHRFDKILVTTVRGDSYAHFISSRLTKLDPIFEPNFGVQSGRALRVEKQDRLGLVDLKKSFRLGSTQKCIK